MQTIMVRQSASLALCLLLGTVSGTARGEKPEKWVEVHSPHFDVVSNASEKQARRVADEFERIRAVFQKGFPGLRVDASAPITVLAVKDEKAFQALLPEDWLRKGLLKRSGMFLHGRDKNFVLLRLDAEGAGTLHILFHEYTHFLLHQNLRSVPLWLDEGLAEFYGNSEFHAKEVWLGQPAASHVLRLRESRLLPLEILFAVDHSSPYYNEENKGSIFYAESWALTHYFLVGRGQGKQSPLAKFLTLVGQDVDPSDAAVRAFGDLRALQVEIESYVGRPGFNFLRMNSETGIKEDDFSAHELSAAESAAVRGDFLAHNGQIVDARALLEEALRRDPKLAEACESLGILELQEGNREAGRKWIAQAVQLESRSYLAHFYFAEMAMEEGIANLEDSEGIEKSLRMALRLNPNFAPAYDALAVLYLSGGEKLDEAQLLELKAIEFDPGNFAFYLNEGNILLRKNRPDDAVRLGEHAMALVKSGGERSSVESFLEHARQYQQQMAAEKKWQQQASRAAPRQDAESAGEDPETPRDEEDAPPVLRRRGAPAQEEERHVAEGRITEAHCSPPTILNLKLTTPGEIVKLRAEDCLKIQYLSAGFSPAVVTCPCEDLRGKRARVVYVETENGKEVVSVEIKK